MQLFSLLLIGAAALVTAQTFTDCDPRKRTCANDPALGISHHFVLNTSTTVDDSFTITPGALVYTSNGSESTIHKIKDSPTIQSKFYIFFGSVRVIMKAASGQGIVSSIVLEPDDRDEIDWEFLGGNGTHVETNYFGKGTRPPSTNRPDREFTPGTSFPVREIPRRPAGFSDPNGKSCLTLTLS
ncbi:hypothetical protein LZ554_008798 [Drepanopeziza brunnea f. sp. 'monogermtubi']|nr:hypothetical protein LZ554_008798 [Drepanopeziza brunnea f. sp. 'monogermtubi']